MNPSDELSRPAPPRRIDGPSSLLAGVRFIVLRPRSWRLAIVPVVVAFLVIGLCATLGVWGALHAASAVASHLGGGWEGFARVALDVLLGAVALVLSLMVGISLAQPLSGFALDALSRECETELGGPLRPDGPALISMLRSLRVTLTALVIGVPLLGLLALADVVFPPALVVTIPLKVTVTSLLIAWDLLDYPFSLRGMRVRERVRWISANFGAVLGFGVLAAIGFFIPGLGLLVLPIGVAGATHLVVRRERALPAGR